MSNQRKQIIVNEIAFWKKNKMLPEHYCDFLTSLYMGGMDEKGEYVPDPKQSIIAKEKKAAMLKFLIYPIVAIAAIGLIQFIPFDWLGIGIGLFLGLAFAVYGLTLAKKKHLAAPLLHVSGSLLLLAMTVKLAITYFDGNNNVLYAILSFNCGLWIILGVWQRLIYFTIAGGLGFVVVIGYALFLM